MRKVVLLALMAASTWGCAAPMIGAGSLTVLSREMKADGQNVRKVGEAVKESDCFHMFLFLFGAGTPAPSHEALVRRTLDKYDADALVDARLSMSVVPLFPLYMGVCTTVEGQPVRVVKGGNPQ